MNKPYLVKILIFILITSLITNSHISLSQNSEIKTENPIPFNNFFLRYLLKVKINQLPLPVVNFTVFYQDYPNKSMINSNYDFIIQITSQSQTLLELGIAQENATFFENSSTRDFYLNSSEGQIIERLLTLIYNPSENVSNWSPFWIFSDEIISQVEFTYPIYSFQMIFNFNATLGPSDFPFFNVSHDVWGFRVIATDNRSGSFLEHDISLIYDDYTGILLKGLLKTNLTEANITTRHVLDFELAETNAFSVFPPLIQNNSLNSSLPFGLELPPPNYLILSLIFITPLGAVLLMMFRIKEIDGGLD